jgi:ankyrin repeat protein
MVDFFLQHCNKRINHSGYYYPLQVSAEKEHDEIVARILQHKYGIDAKCMVDALNTAARKGCVNIVKMLIEKGVNVHSSHTLLQSVRGGNCDVVKLLLEQGVEVNRHAVIETVISGHVDVLKLLIPAQYHPTTNAKTIVSSIPTIQFLVDCGARTIINDTLMYCVNADKQSMVEALVAHADAHCRDNALQFSLSWNRSASMMEQFLKHGSAVPTEVNMFKYSWVVQELLTRYLPPGHPVLNNNGTVMRNWTIYRDFGLLQCRYQHQLHELCRRAIIAKMLDDTNSLYLKDSDDYIVAFNCRVPRHVQYVVYSDE